MHTRLADIVGRLPSVQEKEQESPILLLQCDDNTTLPNGTGHRMAEGETL